MQRAHLPALLAALLVVVSIGSPIATTSTAQATSTPACETSVVHDRFRTDEAAMDAIANGSTVNSTESNTRVSFGEDGSFYRLAAENPNGYCVEFVVQIGSGAMPTVDLPGTTTSTNDQFNSTWRSTVDFEANATYTQVMFTLPANTSAAWAPNEYRVKTLSWASQQKDEGESILYELKRWFGQKDLERRTYIFSANNSTRVTVSLVDRESGRRVKHWRALYSTNDGESWRPMDQDSDDPVFYRELEGDEAVEFVFNDKDARVKFVANPSAVQQIKMDWWTVDASLSDLDELIPFLGGDG